MSLKRPPSSQTEENWYESKRRCIEFSREGTVSLLDLNDHCLLRMAEFLNYEERDTFALVCKLFNEIRCHHSFIRRRTIVCRGGPNKSFLTFVSNMKAKGFDKIFAQPNTHLKIRGLENLQKFAVSNLDQDFILTGVTKLDISSDASHTLDVCTETVFGLALMVPNVEGVDMSYTEGTNIFPNTGTITTFTYNGTYEMYGAGGFSFNTCMPNLSFLSIEECTLFGSFNGSANFANEESEKYLFMECKNLERLSIKGGTFVTMTADDKVPIPQQFLFKMVRRHPTLRWLRSDLTAENIAMLKQERPHMTFVSE